MVDRRTTARGSLIGDPGLYGPTSQAWRLNREATLLLGAGPRALLLQVAHPLIAEGVDQHSDFREDPWRRLVATLRSYLTIVYGSGPAARAEIRRLNALHRLIEGPVRDPDARSAHGPRYRARDPELALWVHATLIDSTLAAFDAWIEPASRADRARFYAETLPIARAFGIPAALLPADIDAFDAYVAGMLAAEGPIRVSPTARELSRFILRPALGRALRWDAAVAGLLDRVPRSLYAWTLWPAVALVPARVRAEYGITWGVPERALSAWLGAGIRAWRPLIPPSIRWMPQALVADRRVGAGRQ